MQGSCCELIVNERRGGICKGCRIATEYTISRKLACRLRVLSGLIQQSNLVAKFVGIKIVHLLAIVLELRWHPRHIVVVEGGVG
jgi:hypothetical protein